MIAAAAMLSSINSSNQFDGRAATAKRNFFKNTRKNHSINSEGGIDLKKIKAKFTCN